MSAARGERPRHLAHVDVAARVYREAVRGPEFASRDRAGTAPAPDHVAVTVVDADPTRFVVAGRTVTGRRLTRLPPELGDVRASLAVEHDVGRAPRVGPLVE